MHELYELKEMLCKELEEYGRKGEMTAGSLEVIDKLAHALKNLDKVIESKESESEDYSMATDFNMGDGSYDRGSMDRGGNSYRGSSYARGGRGRGRNARRDSMGRYSRERGYSYADGMQEMAESIRDMMQELPPEIQHDAQKFVQKLEQHMM